MQYVLIFNLYLLLNRIFSIYCYFFFLFHQNPKSYFYSVKETHARYKNTHQMFPPPHRGSTFYFEFFISKRNSHTLFYHFVVVAKRLNEYMNTVDTHRIIERVLVIACNII